MKIGEFGAHISYMQSHTYGCAHNRAQTRAITCSFAHNGLELQTLLLAKRRRIYHCMSGSKQTYSCSRVYFGFSFFRPSNDFNKAARWAVSQILVMMYLHRQQIYHVNNHLYWFHCIVHLTKTTTTLICYMNVSLHRLHFHYYFI